MGARVGLIVMMTILVASCDSKRRTSETTTPTDSGATPSASSETEASSEASSESSSEDDADAAACEDAGSDPGDPDALPGPRVGEWVLIRAGADLYTTKIRRRTRSCHDDAARAVLEDASVDAELLAAKVVAIDSSWVTVETVGDLGDRCESQARPLRDYRLRLFVQKTELAPVLRTSIERVEGSAIWRVAAGEALAPRASEWTLRRHPFGLEDPPITVDASRVARSFPRAQASDDTQGEASMRVRLEDLGLPYAWPEPSRIEPVREQTLDEDVSRVRLREGCTSLWTTLRADLLLPPAEDEDRGVGPWGVPVPRFAVEAGTSVWWENGTQAGRTRRRTEYEGEGLRIQPDLVCFDVPVGASQQYGTLRVCHRARALRRVRRAKRHQ